MTEGQNSAPRIVVGIDGSARSKEALRWAARIAAAENATIDAVAAWHLPTYFGFAALPEGFSPKADIEKLLTEAVDEVFGPDRPAGMRLHVFEGDPARMLIEVSKGALMAVVGSRGHGGFSGLLLGSVSMKLAELATCPVLVVHGTARNAEAAS
ncbi:MAG TPA: universal stress protein [Jatrophihabitans sp.]|nr:universal stress protein [Jatrophihabitans sp.]